MGEEVSMTVLIHAIKPVLRAIVRDELERDNKRVTQAVLKMALEDMGAKKGTGEKHVITAGKG